MDCPVFYWGLLCVLMSPAVAICVPTDYTVYVEKQDCDYCVAINTTICMGFCYSRDSNMKELAGPRFLLQRGCVYNKVEYRTAILPGCPSHANPLFTYPVAVSCHCGTCNTDSDECAHKAIGDGARCSKPLRHLYPYPGQSNYINLD
ncbi:thyroid stimulating hormone subunit beta a [Hypomesus transpacificus]|uniref:thyroid stimulating hormone subunit beta a n=1 Tax=Hypomesus transpacificus TaxID=137520 RepID=UPI001F0763AB|nr:thyroid stimulating hormone subunit beta a [Hypomesus transpacificus]